MRQSENIPESSVPIPVDLKHGGRYLATIDRVDRPRACERYVNHPLPRIGIRSIRNPDRYYKNGRAKKKKKKTEETPSTKDGAHAAWTLIRCNGLILPDSPRVQRNSAGRQKTKNILYPGVTGPPPPLPIGRCSASLVLACIAHIRGDPECAETRNGGSRTGKRSIQS